MLDMMLGTGSPMWTAIPFSGSPYQPISFGTRAITTPPFSSPAIAGGLAGGIASNPYQNLADGGVSVAYPFALKPLALPIADAPGIVTASSMLAAVAMRRGQPQGPTNDAEVEEFIYDACELLPGAGDVEVRCEGGRVTISGSAQNKRTKRDVGEIAWAIPGLLDVQNNVSITSRRRGRAGAREVDAPAAVSARKQG
jgi:BON domain